MADKSQQDNSDIAVEKPGQILKAEREKLGLSIKEVATQLNLQMDMINALESDDTQRLPAPTYVRGYIRSYAKIVNLDGNELIRIYEQDAAGPPEIIPDIKSHTQATSTDKPVKAVTYLITFGLVLLLLAWLQSHYVIQREVDENTTTAEDSNEEQFTQLPAYQSEPPSYQQAPERLTEKPVIDPGLSLNIQQTLPEISESISGTIELPDSETSPTDETGSIATEIQSAGTPGTPVIQGDEIQFKLKRDSWIEVYDSGNNRLYMGLAKPGEELKLSGTAPFDVLLGYSPGVEVRFNGKLFDTEPHSRSGIARFTLGVQDSDNASE